MHDGINRPSTLVFALATAASVVCVMLLADLGHWRSAELYALAGVLAFAAIAGLWHGGLAVLGFVLLVVDARRERQPEPVVYAPPDDDEPDAPPEAEIDLRARAWATALGRFFRAGDKAGFTIRALTPAVLSEDDWARLTAYYVSDDGRRVLRDRGGNQGTGWGYGWDLDGAVRAIGVGALPLPGGEPPVVEVFVEHATQRNAKRSKSAVVEGVVVASEKG